MVCPSCGYALTAFDKDCPRCKNLTAAAPKAATPNVASPPPLHVPQQGTPAAPYAAPSPVFVPERKWTPAKILAVGLGAFVLFSLFCIIVLSILGNRIKNTFDASNQATVTVSDDTRANLSPSPSTQPHSGPTSPPQLAASNAAQCGAMNTGECDWVSQASQIIDGSLKVDHIAGESAAAFNARMADSTEQALSDFSKLPPAPPRCARAASLESDALSEAHSLSVYGSTGTDFLTPEGAKQFDDTFNKKRDEVATLYGECAAEFQRLYNS